MKSLKNRRGLALENAIIFMVIVFSLCTLLTTFVLVGTRRTQMSKNALLERVALEEILEDFLADPTAHPADEQSRPDYPDYFYTVTPKDDGTYLLTVFKQTEEATVIKLYAVAAQTDGAWQLTYRDKLPPS
ncbi:MAG: hypothetical protein IJV96_02940 [Clostridia bacterium]|nr:hypothetical protein [Clostridia bacterium]